MYKEPRNKKWHLPTVFALIIMLLLSMTVQPAFGVSESPFSDISGHWAEETITRHHRQGFLSGYPDGAFRPDQVMKRSELMVLINKYFALNDKGEDNFLDVNNTDWFADHAATAKLYGYVESLEAHPNEYVQRKHIVEMLNMLFDYRDFSSSGDISDIGEENQDQFSQFAEMGYLNAYLDGDFDPEAMVNRAEMVTVVHSALGYIVRNQEDLNNIPPGAKKVTIIGSDLVLEGMTIPGDVFISPGVKGNITIRDTVIKGNLVISGGTEGAPITLENVEADRVIVVEKDKPSEIKVIGYNVPDIERKQPAGSDEGKEEEMNDSPSPGPNPSPESQPRSDRDDRRPPAPKPDPKPDPAPGPGTDPGTPAPGPGTLPPAPGTGTTHTVVIEGIVEVHRVLTAVVTPEIENAEYMYERMMGGSPWYTSRTWNSSETYTLDYPDRNHVMRVRVKDLDTGKEYTSTSTPSVKDYTGPRIDRHDERNTSYAFHAYEGRRYASYRPGFWLPIERNRNSTSIFGVATDAAYATHIWDISDIPDGAIIDFRHMTPSNRISARAVWKITYSGNEVLDTGWVYGPFGINEIKRDVIVKEAGVNEMVIYSEAEDLDDPVFRTYELRYVLIPKVKEGTEVKGTTILPSVLVHPVQINASTLIGEIVDPVTNDKVDGTFYWMDQTERFSEAGEYTREWIFVAADKWKLENWVGGRYYYEPIKGTATFHIKNIPMINGGDTRTATVSRGDTHTEDLGSWFSHADDGPLTYEVRFYRVNGTDFDISNVSISGTLLTYNTDLAGSGNNVQIVVRAFDGIDYSTNAVLSINISPEVGGLSIQSLSVDDPEGLVEEAEMPVDENEEGLDSEEEVPPNEKGESEEVTEDSEEDLLEEGKSEELSNDSEADGLFQEDEDDEENE